MNMLANPMAQYRLRYYPRLLPQTTAAFDIEPVPGLINAIDIL